MVISASPENSGYIWSYLWRCAWMIVNPVSKLTTINKSNKDHYNENCVLS